MTEGVFPRMLAVQAVVVRDDGKILLNKREKEPDKGKWQIFATYVRPGERLEEAVRRCLRKDAKISETSSIRFTGKYFDEPGRHPGSFCIPCVFLVRVRSNAEHLRHQNIKWFSYREALGLDLVFDNHKTLQDINQFDPVKNSVAIYDELKGLFEKKESPN